jgi:hypothetical protein
MLYPKYCKKKEQHKIIIKQSVSLGKTEREREGEKKEQIVMFSAHMATVCVIILFFIMHLIFSLLNESLLCLCKRFFSLLIIESIHEFSIEHQCDNNNTNANNNNVRLTIDWSSPAVTTGMISIISS